jgi:hypothetical protein
VNWEVLRFALALDTTFPDWSATRRVVTLERTLSGLDEQRGGFAYCFPLRGPEESEWVHMFHPRRDLRASPSRGKLRFRNLNSSGAPPRKGVHLPADNAANHPRHQ